MRVRKILFSATVDEHIVNFHVPFLEWFKKQGHEVHVATSGTRKIPFVDRRYHVGFERSPVSRANLSAYAELRRLIWRNKYDLIHCHTPMGGVLTRLAARKLRDHGTRVLYTAHGFHFYEGARPTNWCVYFPIEKLLSRYTDCLITINEEDYHAAVRSRFQAGRIELVHGVGVDLKQFTPQTEDSKREARRNTGYEKNEFILICVGELSYRKHQDLLVEVAQKLKRRIPNLRILLVGRGPLSGRMQELIRRRGVEDEVRLLGYRRDIKELTQLSDVAVSASRQEGLPVNVMEAMATGLPMVVTNCRGNRDLVTDERNGYVVGIEDADGFANAVRKLHESRETRQQFGRQSVISIEKYRTEDIVRVMAEIYNREMDVLSGRQPVVGSAA